VFRFVRAEEFVDLFSEGFKEAATQQISLFGFGLCGFYQRGANGSGEFFDYAFGVGDELCFLFDELIWSKADGRREARPGVSASASQVRDESSSVATQTYALDTWTGNE